MGTLTVKLACLQCGTAFEVAEGGDPAKVRCPSCGTAQASIFTYAKTFRLEAVENPAYDRACEAARRGDPEAALAELEEAFRAGYADFERADAEPAFAALRRDPRWAALLKRFRPK